VLCVDEKADSLEIGEKESQFHNFGLPPETVAALLEKILKLVGMAGTATTISSTDALTSPPNITTAWDLAVPLGSEVSDTFARILDSCLLRSLFEASS
jgi:hypothetical protein